MGSQTTGYQYSSRGELTRVDLPSGTVVEYLHDPLGRRIAKKVGGTITEKYLSQGRTKLLAVYNGSGTLVSRFEYADDRLPVAMTKGSTRYFLAYDQVGSLRTVTDASGSVVKTIDYDSFGNVIADSNAVFTVPFGFAGGLFDTDTGLTRFGYRDYDADVGRWTAKDPILFDGGDTDLYGYVVNDPVNGIDTEGTNPVVVAATMSFVRYVGTAAAAAALTRAAVAGGKLAGDLGTAIGNYLQAKGNPPSHWDMDKGAEEWGRRNNVNPKEASEAAHRLKNKDPFGKGKDNWGCDPETGNISDPEGEIMGNLNDMGLKNRQ